MLDDLVKIGITAPSGSNCQMWSFNVLPDRATVEKFARRIKRFYQNLNKTAEKSWLRFLLKLIRKPELDWYYKNHYQRVKEGLTEWNERGKDLLFHGAPAVILIMQWFLTW